MRRHDIRRPRSVACRPDTQVGTRQRSAFATGPTGAPAPSPHQAGTVRPEAVVNASVAARLPQIQGLGAENWKIHSKTGRIGWREKIRTRLSSTPRPSCLPLAAAPSDRASTQGAAGLLSPPLKGTSTAIRRRSPATGITCPPKRAPACFGNAIASLHKGRSYVRRQSLPRREVRAGRRRAHRTPRLAAGHQSDGLDPHPGVPCRPKAPARAQPYGMRRHARGDSHAVRHDHGPLLSCEKDRTWPPCGEASGAGFGQFGTTKDIAG